MTSVAARWEAHRLLCALTSERDLAGESGHPGKSQAIRFGMSATTLDWPAIGMVFTRGAGKETGVDILNLETHRLQRVLGADPAPDSMPTAYCNPS
jgi:hypothetical protein